MKTSSIILTVFIALSIIVSSCDKEPKPQYVDLPKTTPVYNNIQKLTDFIKKNETKFQQFKIDASKGGTITSINGVKYKISPNAFVDNFGAPVTGMIDISIKEILNISDMILSNKPTLTSKGEMLQSFGEFMVKAQQNNNKLNVRKDSNQMNRAIQIALKNKNKLKEIPLWDGDTTITTTLNGHNYENQPITKSSQITILKGVEWKELISKFAITDTDSIWFELPSLFKWVNCDAITNLSSNKTTVLCYFENYFNNETTTDYMGLGASMCFFKPDNQNTVIKLYNLILDAPAGKEGFLSYQNAMPVGVKGTFLAVSVKDDKFYCQTKVVTIASPDAGKNYTPISFQLKEVTETELLNTIKSLNQ